MGKETDDLLHLANQVSDTRPGREMDMLITAGERKAMALLCMALHDLGVPSDSFTGSQAGIITDTDHTKAKIVEVRATRLRQALAAGRVPVVGGAQGVSTDHDVTFLGRGGTDTTAVALAQALGADACEIYTDVSGVFTADPRVVPEARRLQAGQFRGNVGDVRRRLPEAGHAFRGVCPQPRRSAARPFGVHVGAGHLDRGGGPRGGAGHGVCGGVGQFGGEADGHRRAGPAGHCGPAVPGPGRPLDQRRHDRTERVGVRHDGYLVHRPPRRPGHGGRRQPVTPAGRSAPPP